MIQGLLTIRNQVKIYHWQTQSYSRHIASDGLTATLDTLIDTFVEVYMGKYGRPKLTGKTSVLPLENFSEKSAAKMIDGATNWIQHKMSKKLHPQNDTDLINIRDEIVAELNKIRYLFTLN